MNHALVSALIKEMYLEWLKKFDSLEDFARQYNISVDEAAECIVGIKLVLELAEDEL